MIKFNQATKYFKEKCILDHVNLTLPETGLVIVQGKSGCGKSTLLNMVAGIEPLDSGSIETRGSCAYLLSTYDFIEELTVLENIILKPSKYCRKKVLRLVKYLGIESLLYRKVSQCSDGQRQRIAVARALAFQQPILLCDEPSEFLDKENRQLVIDLLIAYAQAHLVIIVSHDLDIIGLSNATLYTLENGQLILIHKQNNQPLVKKQKTLAINCQWVLNKVMMKSRLLMVFLITFILITFFSLFCFYQYYLENPTTFNALITDTVYYSKDSERTSFTLAREQFVPEFHSITFQEQLIRIKPLPYDGMRDDQLILVNQNCNEYGFKENDVLQLNYQIRNQDYYLEYPIDAVIVEDDLVGCYVYYNLAKVVTDLDSIMDINYMGESESHYYSMMCKKGLKNYQAKLDYSKIEHQYEIGKLNDIIVFQPLFSQRYAFDQNAMVYRFVFWVTIGLMFGFVLYVIVHLLIKQYHSLLKTISILVVYNASLNNIKKSYMLNHGINIFLVMLITILCITLSTVMINVHLNQTLSLIDMLISLAILVAYLFSTITCIYPLNKEKISSIIKG